MREELREIEKKLVDNGWVLSVPAKEEEMAEYVKSYNNGENVVGIEIALDKCSLGCYGHYGIGCIQLVKYEADMPYIRDDFRRMQEIIYEAEKDLIKAGIPFRPTYAFSQCTEHYLGENLQLREQYHLNEYEKEDWEQ